MFCLLQNLFDKDGPIKQYVLPKSVIKVRVNPSGIY